MADVKEQLAGVAKYGFWIMCGVSAVGALGVGFWSTSALQKDRDAQISKLDGEKSSMESIRTSLSTHPNDATKKEMDALIALLQDDVSDSWTKQYERQKELLVWPVEELQQDFVDYFEPFEPIELTIEFPVPPEKVAPIGLLNRYRDYIGEVLPDIAAIAGAEWTADIRQAAGGGMGGGGLMGGGMPGMPGMGGEGDGGYPGGGYPGGGYPGGSGTNALPDKDQPLVRWQKASQEALLTNLFPWRGKDPNTLDVLYSQENLWVLRQLMEVISSVNGDAKLPFQATIREIKEIAIGKAATGGPVQGGSGGMVGPGMDVGSFDPGAGGMPGMPGADGAAAEATDPADKRYVDVNFDPVEAATLRSAMASSSPTDAPFTVAKRIPVKINVLMDQRKIPLLVAECGNAPLMIEVRQVRLNPTKQAPGMSGGGMGPGGMPGVGSGGAPGGMPGLGAGGGGGGEGMGPGGMPGMGGPGGMPGMGGGMGGGGYGGAARSEFPNDITVEVLGIIYIYNPPHMEKLGIEQVDENTVIAGDTETVAGESVAAEPAATEPAATEPAEANGESVPLDDSNQPAVPPADEGAVDNGAPPVAGDIGPAADGQTPPTNPGNGPAEAPGIAPGEVNGGPPAPADAGGPAGPGTPADNPGAGQPLN